LWSLQEAPLDWQFQTFWGPLRLECFMLGFGALLASNSCLALMSGFWATAAWTFAAASCLICSCIAHFSVGPSAWVSVIWLMLSLFLISQLMYYGTSLSSSSMYVYRSTGMICVCWRVLVPFAAFRLLPCSVFVLVNTSMECIMMRCVLTRLGSVDEIHRVDKFSVVASCLTMLWCYGLAVHWHSLWSVQEELKAQMAASESLLSMVCDATAWVDSDGDTVLRSNARLDEIMGSQMEGRLLSDRLSATEQCRIHSAFSRWNGDGQRTCGGPTVVLLPTTFSPQASSTINVDLFIVKRRPSFALVQSGSPSSSCLRLTALAMKSAFLLGFRLSPTADVTPESQNGNNVAIEKSANGPSISRRHRHMRFDEERSISASDSKSGDSEAFVRSSFSRPSGKSPRIKRQAEVYHTEPPRRLPPLPDFTVSQDEYLSNCAQSMLEDILTSFNFELNGCCQWHASLRVLSQWLNDMHTWYTCIEPWPKTRPAWQCETCSALISSSEDDTVCWMCTSTRHS